MLHFIVAPWHWPLRCISKQTPCLWIYCCQHPMQVIFPVNKKELGCAGHNVRTASCTSSLGLNCLPPRTSIRIPHLEQSQGCIGDAEAAQSKFSIVSTVLWASIVRRSNTPFLSIPHCLIRMASFRLLTESVRDYIASYIYCTAITDALLFLTDHHK